MRVRLEPPAVDEFAEATAYFADKSPQVAENFVAEVVAGMNLLTQFPLLLRTFPYQLVYRVLGDEIRVYAVAHLKRSPRYWLKRLQ